MPLPPALAARLAKRGLLKQSQNENEPVEEVIAEDYDEPSNLKSRSEDSRLEANEEEKEDEEFVHQTIACPNKVNPYHVCVDYCQKKWGYKRFKADPDMTTKRERLLSKYPVPMGWIEVGDPETGRYYYWNTLSDEVSWLPPHHPRADVTLPADRIKELRMTNERVLNRRDSQGESSSDDESTDLDDEDIDDLDEEEKEDNAKTKEQMEPPSRGRNKRRRGGRDDLDPMDPAAYSDVPRGDWSTGLDQRGSAKTGVDVTASGPLFQQRPYPSPGAVLRMNKGPSKKD